MANEGGKGNCAICGVETTLKCQRCSSRGVPPPFYCGKEHQLEHWKKGGHRKECGGTDGEGETWERLVRNGVTFFMAKKDLPAGHLLFHRKPLLFFPALPTVKESIQFSKTVKDNSIGSAKLLTCVGCLEALPYGIGCQTSKFGIHVTKCFKCGWPLHCNMIVRQELQDCQKVHEAECKILCDRGLHWNRIWVERDDREKYYFLALIRATLLSKAQKKEFFSYPVPSPNLLPFVCPPSIIPFVREKCGIPISEEEATKMLTIIFGNILCGPTKHVLTNNKLGYVMYSGGPTGQVLIHNCIPNCAPYVENDMSASFKTIVEVKKGDVLSMNYSDYKRGPHERQMDLTMMLQQYCDCNMCRDPTEGGTFSSAIKCTNGLRCRNQYLLPEQKCLLHGGVRVVDLYTWKCQNKSCGSLLSQQAVLDLTKSLNVENLNPTQRESAGRYEELKSFIERHSGKVVHPNHLVITFAEMQVASLATVDIRSLEVHSEPGFQFDLHEKYLSDFDTVLKKLKMIQPGRIPDYGEVLFCQTQMRMSKMAEDVRDMDQDELDSQLKLLMEDMEESWIVINDNPMAGKYDRSAERKLRTFYANHLLKTIEKVFPNWNNLESVKTFKTRYGSLYVDLKMSEEEAKYRQIMFFPPSEIPKLIEKLNDPKSSFTHMRTNNM